jgi:hypothetical protein
MGSSSLWLSVTGPSFEAQSLTSRKMHAESGA